MRAHFNKVFSLIMNLLILAILCGAAVADTRIAGGKPASPGMFPYQVAVRHSSTFICGGALIGPQWVLTSAECVSNYDGTEYAFSVYVGGLTITTDPEAGRAEIGVQSVYAHPKFRTKDTLYYYNIGLMRLSFPVTIGPTVGLVGLPDSGTVVGVNQVGELAGWGGTNAKVSPTLQWAQMTTINIEDCTNAVGGGNIFTSAQVCTYAHPGPSACWYDHGGALVDNTPTSGRVILGITAYAGCLDPTHPTIYTSVGFRDHRDWILQITGL